MNGFSVPNGIIYTALFLLSSALMLVSPDHSVGAGMARNPVSAPAAKIGIASDAAVHRTKDSAPAADDTGRNERDREGQTMTPLDQSNDPKDLNITRKIRKALMADEALSTTAKNIKIITVHGKVILRGPVATVQEKKKVTKMAQKFTKQRVLNELEVAAQ
jgi:hyperosmotically inducible protein